MSKQLTKENLVTKGVDYIIQKKETLFLLSSFKKKFSKYDVSDSNIVIIEDEDKELNYFRVEDIQLKVKKENVEPLKEKENGTA